MSETGWPRRSAQAGQHRLETLQYEARQLNFSSPAALANSLRLQWLRCKARKYTMVLRRRLWALYHLAQTLERIPVHGDIVECGVYNGGSATYFVALAIQREVNRGDARLLLDLVHPGRMADYVGTELQIPIRQDHRDRNGS